MAKGGSKLLTGIIAFFLGFLFAIIVEVGVIVGAGYYVLNADLDTLFGMVGFTNRDEENRQYVNTDTETGGVKNVMGLYQSLVDIYGRIGAVTLTEMETLFPALDGLTLKLYDALDDYVTVDWDEFETTAFMDLPLFIQDKVMDIRPAAIMRNAGMGGLLDSNVIVSALLEGVEAKYAYVNPADKDNSLKYPVYYDEYIKTDLGGHVTINRTAPVDGNDAYPANLLPAAADWLTETSRSNSDGKTIYRQYYYAVTNGDDVTYVATKQNEDGDFVYSAEVTDNNRYLNAYGDNYQYLSGDYYYDNDGNEVAVTPVTIRTMSEDAMAPLYSVAVTDVLGDEDMIVQIFGDTSLGELINGEANIPDMVDNLELASVIDVKASDPVMLYMGYNVTGAINNGDGTYSAVYAAGTAGEKAVTVYVSASGVVEKVVDEHDNKVGGVTVGTVGDVVGNVTSALTIGDMMDIEADNMIMCYLAYGISNVKEVTGQLYTHTATYEKSDGSNGTAYVFTKHGTKVIDYVTMDAPDGEKLACTTIDGVADAVDGIRITSLMQVEADNSIMAYLAYGVTDIVYDGTEYKGKFSGEEVTVHVDAEGYIVSVEKGDGTFVPGTSIDDISSRLENLTADLALTDVMDVEPTKFRPDGTVEQNNNIMTFIAFSVSDVSIDGGVYKGVYNLYDESGVFVAAYPCKMIIDSEGYISYVVYDADGDDTYESTGVKTKIDGVPDQIGRLTSTLRIKDIVDIDGSNRLMVKLGDYKIDKVGDAIDEFELADAIEIDATDPIMLYLGYGITDLAEKAGEDYTHTGKYSYTVEGVKTTVDCFITLDGIQLTKAYYMDGGEKATISGTTLNTVDERVTDLTDNIAIGDVMDVEADNKIMMYIAYGLTEIKRIDEDATNATFSAKNGGETVYIYTDKSAGGYKIIGFYADSAHTSPATVQGTKISGVGDKVGTLTSDLTVGDVIDPGDDELLLAISTYKLDNLSDAVNALGLDIFVKNIKPDDAILMYVTYGVNGVQAKDPALTGVLYSHTGLVGGLPCYITTDASGYVTGVYKDAACSDKFPATTVDGVSDRIGGLTETLTIGEIVNISADNTVLSLVKDSTINQLNTTIANISIQRLYADEIYETDAEGKAKVYKCGTDGDIAFDAKYVYYTDAKCTNLAGMNGKLTSIGAGETYYTHGKTKGIWSMLLTEGGSEQVYTINEFGGMMNTATSNIKNGTLGDLQECGIIDSSMDLNKYIKYWDAGTMSFKTYPTPLSGMKLSELIEFIINYLAV